MKRAGCSKRKEKSTGALKIKSLRTNERTGTYCNTLNMERCKLLHRATLQRTPFIITFPFPSSFLQCVSVCCSVLQCFAARRVAVCVQEKNSPNLSPFRNKQTILCCVFMDVCFVLILLCLYVCVCTYLQNPMSIAGECRSIRFCLFTLFTKNMSPKGENKHPAKILPGDHKGDPLPLDSQRAGEVGYFSNERGFSEESSDNITTHFIEILLVESKKIRLMYWNLMYWFSVRADF